MSQETDLDRRIADLPSGTKDEAWRVLAIGFDAILATPLGEQRTPTSLIKDKAALQTALLVVDDFLWGGSSMRELDDAETSAFGAAVVAWGLFRNDLTGPAAAGWAVAWLIQATLASVDQTGRAAHVPGMVALVARLCRQAGPTTALEAIAFQGNLLKDFASSVAAEA